MERPELEHLLERVRRESEGLDPLPPFRLVSFQETDRCHCVISLTDGEATLWIARSSAPGGAFWKGRFLAVGYPNQVWPPNRIAFLRGFCARLERLEDRLPESFFAALGRPSDAIPARQAASGTAGSGEDPADLPAGMPPPPGPEALPRLLAPLSSAANAKALAWAGADAFYSGIVLGSLRDRLPGWSDETTRNPPKANLSPEGLADTVALCHRMGRPLYLAMNRPYPPAAFPGVLGQVARAVEEGVDGLVVADWALAQEVRRRWPDLVLVASTVLGIQNPEGLRLAREVGFRRVVLPRPLKIREIRALAERSPVDLEVFVARERCRFQNATCHLEHCPPGRPGDLRLEFDQDAWCIRALDSDEGPFRVDLGPETLESCGLCAVAALRDLPRIRSFKIVGRGLPLPLVLPFVQVARRILDRDLRYPEEVRREVRMDGRIRCSPSSCYFPEDPPAPGRDLPRPRPRANPRSAFRWSPVPEVPDRRIGRWGLLPFGTRDLPTLEGLEGVLVGHETCVHLMPSPAAARGLARQILEAGRRLGLVLPPLFGTREARKGLALAEAILSLHPEADITAGDAGTLAALREGLGWSFPLALGRLLVPQRNDPRLARFPPGHPARDVLPNLAMGHLEALVDRFRVSRVEISIPIRWPRSALPWPTGVHLGPTLLSVARACPTFNGLLQGPGEGRPFVAPETCPRPCLGRSRAVRDRDGGESFLVEDNGVWTGLPLPEGPPPDPVDRWILHRSALFPEGQTARDSRNMLHSSPMATKG